MDLTHILSRQLNIIGLIIAMVGSFLMYYFTPKISYRTRLFNKEEESMLKAKEDLMNKRMKQGMFLLFMGFVLQVISFVL